MLPTDLTVNAVVEKNDRFLIVEKRVRGSVVVAQPGAHIETGESPEQAVVRGTLAETGCKIAVSGLLGVYLWIHPQTREQYLRVVYTANLVKENVTRVLDEPVLGVHWYSRGDIKNRSAELRSPIVSRCVDDFVVGKCESTEVLAGLMPIQNNVAAVIASARLV